MELRIIPKEELKNILTLHVKWLLGEPDGIRANLRSADLRYANLRSADLRYANLSSANLSSADLSSANLRYANLRYANLRSADLSSANLSSADLSSADLRYANLSSADLVAIKEQFFKVAEVSFLEILGLYEALNIGTVDGSQYEGECACLVGTIAKIRKENYRNLSIDLRPASSSLSERWFLGIKKGDIPQSNIISKITCEWIEEFCKDKGIELPTYKIVSSFELERLNG